MRQSDTVSPIEEVQGQRSPEIGFRPDIEGLRGLTLLAILGFRVAMPGVGGGFVGPAYSSSSRGFVITGQLWREVSTTGTVGRRKFDGKRARRLLPVSAMVGVVTAITSALLLPPLQAKSALMDGIASALYVPNFWLIGQQVDYFAGNVLPLAVPALLDFGRGGTVLSGVAAHDRRYGVADPAYASAGQDRCASVENPVCGAGYAGRGLSFALSLMITYVMPLAAYFSLPTRAWQLAGGALVALTAGHWRRLPERAAVITG